MKKTTQATVVSNLQKAIDQKRDEYNSKMNLYNQYMYKMAISKTIDDKTIEKAGQFILIK